MNKANRSAIVNALFVRRNSLYVEVIHRVESRETNWKRVWSGMRQKNERHLDGKEGTAKEVGGCRNVANLDRISNNRIRGSSKWGKSRRKSMKGD